MNTRADWIHKIAKHESGKYISMRWLTEVILMYDFVL